LNFKYQEFGLKKDNLYEVLATTFSISTKEDKIKPNTSCMGIRFIDDNILKMTPHPNTTTLKNLKENGFIGINFVDNIYLYALAALKSHKSSIGLTEFPIKYYNYYDISNWGVKSTFDKNYGTFPIPYVNKAWLSLLGNAIEENKIYKKNSLGEVEITEFTISIKLHIKQRDSFKYFNRAENLALEAIVLATRLKVAKEMNNFKLFDTIYEKIIEYKENVERFGKNKDVLKVFDLVSNYITSLID